MPFIAPPTSTPSTHIYSPHSTFHPTLFTQHPTQRELRTNGVSPFSLLSQPSVVERLQAEGSAFVTSNFLFSEPHLQQNMRVAGSGGSVGGEILI